MCTLLLGDYVSIDTSDASGMNLFNIRDKKWSTKILQSFKHLIHKDKVNSSSINFLNPKELWTHSPSAYLFVQ